jgi:hypothetical protein
LHTYRLPLALATLSEPGTHSFRQTLGLYAGTRFEEAFGDRESVVKLGGPGKIAHTEIVKPIERAGAARGANNDFDAQPVSKHDGSIAPAGMKARA